MDRRIYIAPKEMDFISYVLNSRDYFQDEVIEYQLSRLKNRIEYLRPLREELINKGIDIKVICYHLYYEFKDLDFLYNRFKDEL